MKTIEYKATYGNGDEETLVVQARDINSGFGKALKGAKEPMGNGYVREIARLEFWAVR